MKTLMRLIEYVVTALMGVIAATVVVEVAIRDLFHLSLGVHEELTRYLMVWVAMLGSALLTWEDGHIRITLLPDALSPRARMLVRCVADLVAVFFLAGFVYACAMSLPNMIGQNTVTLGIGMVWFHAALPVGGALMLVIALRNTWLDTRAAVTGAVR